jgi:hypothetical protein
MLILPAAELQIRQDEGLRRAGVLTAVGNFALLFSFFVIVNGNRRPPADLLSLLHHNNLTEKIKII